MLKFRAWFELEKKMVASENLIFEYDGREENLYVFAFDDETYYLDSDNESQIKGTMSFIPMLCTGIKDKNGKEIYEGDIVKCFKTFNSTIVFRSGCFGLISENHVFYPFSEIYGECEVIGNIYENSELINE